MTSIDKESVTCLTCGWKGRIEDLHDPAYRSSDNMCTGEWCVKCGSGEWEFDFLIAEDKNYF